MSITLATQISNALGAVTNIVWQCKWVGSQPATSDALTTTAGKPKEHTLYYLVFTNPRGISRKIQVVGNVPEIFLGMLRDVDRDSSFIPVARLCVQCFKIVGG